MKQRYIPENVLQGKRFLSFRVPNLIEGAIWALIATFIISKIPFVPKVKWIFIICTSIFLLLVNGLGIKGQRFSKTIINYIVYKSFLKKAPYRRLNFDPEPTELFFKDTNGNTRVRTVHEKTTIGKVQRIFKH